MVSKWKLLEVLPPYEGVNDLIAREQSIADIVNLTRTAHKEFAPHYDRIVPFWQSGPRLPEQLFNFVKDNVRYSLESEQRQTIESPAAILTEGKGDCKHYSVFIAGILDAMNRAGLAAYDWKYRFAAYDGEGISHVFIVLVDPDGAEIWIDPAPVFDDAGRRTERTFNDDLSIPTSYLDIKPKTMALYKVSGISSRRKEGIGKPIRTTTLIYRTKPPIEQKTCPCVGYAALIATEDSFATEGGGGGSFQYFGSVASDMPYNENDGIFVEEIKTVPPSMPAPQVGPASPTVTPPPPREVMTVPQTIEPAILPGEPATDGQDEPGAFSHVWNFVKANPFQSAIIAGVGIWLISEERKKRKKGRRRA